MLDRSKKIYYTRDIWQRFNLLILFEVVSFCPTLSPLSSVKFLNLSKNGSNFYFLDNTPVSSICITTEGL